MILFLHVQIALVTIIDCREFREIVNYGELSGIQGFVE